MVNICGEKILNAKVIIIMTPRNVVLVFTAMQKEKKVVGISLCSDDIIREINWIWYNKSHRISERQKIELKNGDCYIMSEKSSGFDWKRRNVNTLRHAAGVKGNKYLK